MAEFLVSLVVLLKLLFVLVAFSALNATLNTLYYWIRDHHWSWKWWLFVFRDAFHLIGAPLSFLSSSSSSSSHSSSGKSKDFKGGSSRGGGSGRSF